MTRPEPDLLLQEISDYVLGYGTGSLEAVETARYCLLDSLGCAILALGYPECVKLLGPVVEGTVVPNGCRVPGRRGELDPIKAAFDLGSMIRWLDFNDTWLAAEWGHPSDNLGAILSVTDFMSRRNRAEGKEPLRMSAVLRAMVQAHEIQGVLALENSFNRVGLDHVLLVRVASTAVATALLGGTREAIINAVSNAWLDGGTLRAYRHAPNTGWRKSWAAGDATSRGTQHAWMAVKGEMGYPSALSASRWGFSDVLLRGEPVRLGRELGCYVMENVLFKIAFPAEFHAQTAVEAAIQLHPSVVGRLDEVEGVMIETQEPALRIIDKTGPLHNPADRDHCLQYMVAAGLVFGELTARHYEEPAASDGRIDLLRGKMHVREDKRYTREYLEPGKRSIANAVQVFFGGGDATARVEVEYPLGHRRRRREGIPLLLEKARRNLGAGLPAGKVDAVMSVCGDREALLRMPVDEFMELFQLS